MRPNEAFYSSEVTLIAALFVFGRTRLQKVVINREIYSIALKCEHCSIPSLASAFLCHSSNYQVLARFKNGSCRVLVATNVAARGLDMAGACEE